MSNLSSTNDNYESAKAAYQALANRYTGNAGYQNSLDNAAKGSTAVANGVASQTKAAARNAGLSKSAAAALGQSNVQKAYTDAFTGQQESAYKAGLDSANAGKDVMTTEQTEGNNKYDRAAGNATAAVQGAGTLASALLSDASMKDLLKKLNGPKSVDEMYSSVKNYLYKYNDKAVKNYGENGNKIYAGSTAQDLQKIPGAVVKDNNGVLNVDTQHLSTENAAAISEILQRLRKLEKK